MEILERQVHFNFENPDTVKTYKTHSPQNEKTHPHKSKPNAKQYYFFTDLIHI